jgi:hypothetical protein
MAMDNASPTGNTSTEPVMAMDNASPTGNTSTEPVMAMDNASRPTGNMSSEPTKKARKEKKAKGNGIPERRSMRIQGRLAATGNALVVDPHLLPVKDEGNDPRTYRQAMACDLQKQWKEAMRQEYASLIKNNTFTPVSEANSQPIGCKWVY